MNWLQPAVLYVLLVFPVFGEYSPSTQEIAIIGPYGNYLPCAA